jgi:protein-S-isoprenylcysteine O-methyltransferase Ste14
VNRAGKRSLGLEVLPRVLWVLMFVCLLVGQRVLDRPVELTAHPGRLVAGTLLTVTGAAFWFYVGWIMRRSFFGRRLLTHGPFTHIRHPMYVGVYVMLAGLGILLGTWPWLAIMAVFALIWYLEMIVEERHMARVYGPPYEIYRRQTGMVFPKLVGLNRPRSGLRKKTNINLNDARRNEK